MCARPSVVVPSRCLSSVLVSATGSCNYYYYYYYYYQSSRQAVETPRDGPSARVAGRGASAGRGLCRRAVSDERFHTGARKRLPGERRAVGRGTGTSVSAGRVPSGPGRRFRPVHVRNGTVHAQVLRAELGVRGTQMLATQRIDQVRGSNIC